VRKVHHSEYQFVLFSIIPLDRCENNTAIAEIDNEVAITLSHYTTP
jgi:hypothetical protein